MQNSLRANYPYICGMATPLNPALFMVYYQQQIGKIIDAFQSIESMIDVIIAIYFGNSGTFDDLLVLLQELNFEIKLDALRIVTQKKCPDIIRNELITTKYLLEANATNDKFFKSLRSFKKLRNAVAHATVRSVEGMNFNNASLENPPSIEFITFERPDQLNSEKSSYIKTHRTLTKVNLENIFTDYNFLHDIITGIHDRIS